MEEQTWHRYVPDFGQKQETGSNGRLMARIFGIIIFLEIFIRCVIYQSCLIHIFAMHFMWRDVIECYGDMSSNRMLMHKIRSQQKVCSRNLKYTAKNTTKSPWEGIRSNSSIGSNAHVMFDSVGMILFLYPLPAQHWTSLLVNRQVYLSIQLIG